MFNKFLYSKREKTKQEVAPASNLDEEKVIQKYLKRYKIIPKYSVDIGASDGISMSNTYGLFKSGWKGLALECDKDKFYKLAENYKEFDVSLGKTFVDPTNIVDIFKAYKVPKNFGLLSIDIDGYDYYVLEQLLKQYKPAIICAEINEKIPPPIKFSVKFTKEYFWDTSHFFGMSLSMCDSLCSKDYSLAELEYNNVFYINKKYQKKGLTAVEAYKQGYEHKKDRKEKFPWNEDFEEIFGLNLSSQRKFIKEKFKDYTNQYTVR